MAEANALIRIGIFPQPVKPCPSKSRGRGPFDYGQGGSALHGRGAAYRRCFQNPGFRLL
jgi:hypothetical protein